MSISRQRIRQIIKEELSRVIREGNPDDDEWFNRLQLPHGHFTSPEKLPASSRPHRQTASDADRARAAAYNAQPYSGTTPEEEEFYARWMSEDDDLMNEGDDDEDESPSSGDLVIKRADLEVEYNDAETGSQQASIEVKFTWMDSPGDASVLITSFTERSSYIVDRIAEEINYSINIMSDTEDQNFVNNLKVKMAMGKKLAQIMNEMEQLQEEYDQQARYL